MRKIIAIVALAATSAALAVDTDAGAIITDKNLSQYAKVENAANGTATVTIVDTNGTANAVTVYNKSTLDTALAGKADSSALDGKVSKNGDTMTGPLAFVNSQATFKIDHFTDGWCFSYKGSDVDETYTLEIPWKNGVLATGDDIPSTYDWAEITGLPTTLSGYGITDAKIANGTITLGANSITPLTSYTETDPTALKPAQLKVNGTAMTTSSAAVELGGYYIKTVDGKPHLFLRGN